MSSIIYRNNPKLRAPDTDVPLTQYEIDEFKKCAADPIYFINNYVKIVTLDKGLQQMTLRPYQEKVIDSIHNNRFIIIRFARQSGKSSSLSAYVVWCVLFQNDYEVMVAAHKASAAKEFIRRCKIAIENIPLWLQVGITSWNKASLEFENGSRIESTATTEEAGRSGSKNLVVLDEFAIIDENIANEFYTAMFPVISSGSDSKMAILSTPKGMNHFYQHWKEAESGKSGFIPLEINWWDVPGRDEKFKQKTIAAYGGGQAGIRRWQQEFECVDINTKIILKDKITGEIFETTIGEFIKNF